MCEMRDLLSPPSHPQLLQGEGGKAKPRLWLLKHARVMCAICGHSPNLFFKTPSVEVLTIHGFSQLIRPRLRGFMWLHISDLWPQVCGSYINGLKRICAERELHIETPVWSPMFLETAVYHPHSLGVVAKVCLVPQKSVFSFFFCGGKSVLILDPCFEPLPFLPSPPVAEWSEAWRFLLSLLALWSV